MKGDDAMPEDEARIVVTAPMSGIILNLNVAVGDRVTSGDVLALLEIMKMETEINAPSSGTVESIEVTRGQEVSMGDVLLWIIPGQ